MNTMVRKIILRLCIFLNIIYEFSKIYSSDKNFIENENILINNYISKNDFESIQFINKIELFEEECKIEICNNKVVLISKLIKNSEKNIVNKHFESQTFFYSISKNTFNNITKDTLISDISFLKECYSSFILFALENKNENCYIGYCEDGNVKIIENSTYGLFEEAEILSVKILANGLSLSNLSYMFFKNASIETVIFSKNFNSINVIFMRNMFYKCSNLKNLDLSTLNTMNVISMYEMFRGCFNLTHLNLRNFNTINVCNMGGMFCGCSKLINLDISNFNTINVKNMISMFEGCGALNNLTLSSFEINNKNNIYWIFGGSHINRKNIITLDEADKKKL